MPSHTKVVSGLGKSVPMPAAASIGIGDAGGCPRAGAKGVSTIRVGGSGSAELGLDQQNPWSSKGWAGTFGATSTGVTQSVPGGSGASEALVALGAPGDPGHSCRMRSPSSLVWHPVERAAGGGVGGNVVRTCGCGRGCLEGRLLTSILATGAGPARGWGAGCLRGTPAVCGPSCHQKGHSSLSLLLRLWPPPCREAGIPTLSHAWDAALSQGATSPAAMFLLVIPRRPFLPTS